MMCVTKAVGGGCIRCTGSGHSLTCPEPGHKRRREDVARLRDENDEMRQILCALCLHADGHPDPFIRELAQRAAKCGGPSSDFRRLQEKADA